MSRKKKHIEIQPGEKIDIDPSVKVEAVAIEEPTETSSGSTEETQPDEVVEFDERGRRYVPPPCTLCQALREKNTNKTYVYCVKNRGQYKERYCRCKSCKHTWKIVERIY